MTEPFSGQKMYERFGLHDINASDVTLAYQGIGVHEISGSPTLEWNRIEVTVQETITIGGANVYYLLYSVYGGHTIDVPGLPTMIEMPEYITIYFWGGYREL